MAQDIGIVKDTITGLFCTSYSTTLELCQWGNENDAVQFEDLATAESVANDMNSQSTADRFIGTHPHPH